MESIPDWLEMDPKELEVKEVAIAGDGEPKVEVDEKQGQEVE